MSRAKQYRKHRYATCRCTQLKAALRLDRATRSFSAGVGSHHADPALRRGRVLADIEAYYGDCDSRFLRHGVLLFGAPNQLRSLAGLEHGRTIPLAEFSAVHCAQAS